MKKKLITSLFVGVCLVSSLTACGGESKPNKTTTPPVVETTTKDGTTTLPTTSTEENKLSALKQKALSKLDEIVNPFIAKITNDDLKSKVQEYYDSEKEYITNITDIETAKGALNKVVSDTDSFASKTLVPLAVSKVNETINPLIQAITDEDLKESVQAFYDEEITKFEGVESLADVADVFKEILKDTKDYIKNETTKVIVALKNKALEALDPYVTALINKIPYDTLKTDTQAFYAEEKKLLEAVDTIEGVEPCAKKIKEDLEAYALTETKKLAIGELQEIVDDALAKIPNEDLKADLEEFSEDEIAKLEAVEKLEDVPTTLATVLEETAAHIKSLLVSTVKEYLTRLTQIETATAYDYLPEAMSPFYQDNLVNPEDINYDFSTNTKVTAINLAGYGEQWQMVVENINQSITMAKVFNVAQTALSAAGNAVDIYLDNSYADEMNYSFSGNGYNGVFAFKDGSLVFNIHITEATTIPGIGTVQPIVKMEYDLVNEAKGMFISLGDAYKIKYVITENSYEMATTYGITVLGHDASRTSYLSVAKARGKTTGHIYEYTTFDNDDKIQACADFYVENGFVSVVGNKASGMIGFDGYVNELYKADEGILLGYEVREEKTIAGITGTYNTLWFNLIDISGITHVRVTDKTDSNESSRSTVDVYLNGSDKLLVPTYNKKIIKTSRKYDIELRSRFYYSYDETEKKYIAHEVKVPMMFIQEGDNFNSFTTDMYNDNGISATVILEQENLNKILLDYDTLIDIFIANKDNMSSATIIAYLAQYEEE